MWEAEQARRRPVAIPTARNRDSSVRGSRLNKRTKVVTAMGFFSKDIKTMDDLFVHTLRDIYYAENQILKALPEMIEKATDPQLKQGFQSHLAETKGHVKRVEQVFEMHGVEAKGVDCPAIDGIIDEAEEVTGEVEDKNVLDAAPRRRWSTMRSRATALWSHGQSSLAEVTAPPCCRRTSTRRRRRTRS